MTSHFPNREVVVPLFSRLGLDPAAIDWPVSRLSTGERQRLALARVLLLAPRALLLDEPTSALDAEATRMVEAALREHLQGGAALVVVTHDRRQARLLARRRFHMEAGRLTAEDGGRTAGRSGA